MEKPEKRFHKNGAEGGEEKDDAVKLETASNGIVKLGQGGETGEGEFGKSKGI